MLRPQFLVREKLGRDLSRDELPLGPSTLCSPLIVRSQYLCGFLFARGLARLDNSQMKTFAAEAAITLYGCKWDCIYVSIRVPGSYNSTGNLRHVEGGRKITILL